MKKIELEQWEPFPGDPRRMQYAGQRVAQEVFEELKHRLEGMGYLPDEYFLMDREWENGRKIPKDADIFCAADYGGSEGSYTMYSADTTRRLAGSTMDSAASSPIFVRIKSWPSITCMRLR